MKAKKAHLLSILTILFDIERELRRLDRHGGHAAHCHHAEYGLADCACGMKENVVSRGQYPKPNASRETRKHTYMSCVRRTVSGCVAVSS